MKAVLYNGKILVSADKGFRDYVVINGNIIEEVGDVFGITRERIRQIEAKALRKLRHPSRSKKLKDYLD